MIKKVTNRFPWKRQEILTVAIAGLVALAGGLLGLFGVIPVVTATTITILGLIVLIAGFYLGASKKSKSTLTGLIDEKDWELNVWMKKPTRAIWGIQVEKGKNKGKILDFQVMNYVQVGRNNVFQFILANGRKLVVPERLAMEQEMADFFLAVVEERKGEVNVSSENAMKAFAEVLRKGKPRVKAETKAPEAVAE